MDASSFSALRLFAYPVDRNHMKMQTNAIRCSVAAGMSTPATTPPQQPATPSGMSDAAPGASVADMMATAAAAAASKAMSDPTSWLQTFALFILFFFPTMALLVVIVRSVGRASTRQFGLDDGLIVAAMVVSLAETVASYGYIKTNFIGIHAADIPRGQAFPTREALAWGYAVQVLYNPILALVKSSVLLFLRHLFGQKGGVRRFILALNAANLAHMAAVFFAVVFQCTPVAFNWDRGLPGGRCVDRRVLYTSTAVVTIVTDLLVLGLPVLIFSGLGIPRRTKLALLFVFLLGFLVTIASLVRLILLAQGLFGLVASEDPTFNIGFVTSAIETNLAIMTASAPALRPLLRARAVPGPSLEHNSRLTGRTRSGRTFRRSDIRTQKETTLSLEHQPPLPLPPPSDTHARPPVAVVRVARTGPSVGGRGLEGDEAKKQQQQHTNRQQQQQQAPGRFIEADIADAERAWNMAGRGRSFDERDLAPGMGQAF